ncbi:hypothetical protein [uncultured Psychroserpens sp.]|uniref:hypothetical protein n=1 Tax=uncultured Psychroserpens sp. TaxID=255436 RepID=UPI0026345BC6|nr:hypothetical protein [uncultured Psychroserpens sp.]
MKTQHISLERTLLLIILAIVIFNLLAKQCSKATPNLEDIPKVTIVRDTVWQTKVDTFKVQTLTYQTVYVDRDDVGVIHENLPKTKDSTTLVKARVYKDTLSNDDIDIFSYNLIEGNLLDSEISYKLKVPREITITKTIEHPKTYRSGFYLFSEIGGNQNRFDNISLGLQYNRKGKWFISYRANLNQLQQPTHNLGIGVRLFK